MMSISRSCGEWASEVSARSSFVLEVFNLVNTANFGAPAAQLDRQLRDDHDRARSSVCATGGEVLVLTQIPTVYGPKRPHRRAGIGGLSTAIAPTPGWLEVASSSDPGAARVGFGLGLAPNALAALAELGVADDVLARSFQPACFEARRMDAAC